MKEIINETAICLPHKDKNNIAKRFGGIIENICHIPAVNANSYVDCEAELEYRQQLKDLFVSKHMLFVLGNAGCGKSTFLQHYLNNGQQFHDPFFVESIKPLDLTEINTLIIPMDFSSYMEDVNKINIREHISQLIIYSLKQICLNADELIHKERFEIADYYGVNLGVMPSELIDSKGNTNKIKEHKLIESFTKKPFDSAVMLLKYFLEKHNSSNVQQVVFVVDDLEVLREDTIREIYEYYLKIVEEMEKFKAEIFPAKVIFGMRPHSYRYLKQECGDNPKFTTHHNYFEESGNCLVKQSLPDLTNIITNNIHRISNKKQPSKNLEKWKEDLNTLEQIINRFEKYIITCISQLCHNNIPDSCNVFADVLRNRIWCQYDSAASSYGAFSINVKDYKFDTQSIIRTLGCGEMICYTGNNQMDYGQPDEEFKWYDAKTYDGTCAIPNILIMDGTKELDVFPLITMIYLNSQYVSPMSSKHNHNTKGELCQELSQRFNNVNEQKVADTLDYLYALKIIRKCWNMGDDEQRRKKLFNEDLIYLSTKGKALISILGVNSTLLEMYREDLLREYKDEAKCEPSYTLILKKKHDTLYEDLINLLFEIYYNEDRYYKKYPIVPDGQYFGLVEIAIKGVERSLQASDKVKTKNKLIKEIEQLRKKIKQTISEFKNNK